jgi:hypothetical protein
MCAVFKSREPVTRQRNGAMDTMTRVIVRRQQSHAINCSVAPMQRFSCWPHECFSTFGQGKWGSVWGAVIGREGEHVMHDHSSSVQTGIALPMTEEAGSGPK